MGPRRKIVSADSSAAAIRQALFFHENPTQAAVLRRFFKTGPGEYGAGDEFWGLMVPQVRAVLARFPEVSRATAGELLDSPVHEIRLCGALALVRAYAQGGPDERAAVFDFYLSRSARINNWDLVDASAPGIVGRHLPPGGGRRTLGRLVKSHNLWERRIAMLATLHFIRCGESGDTLRLAAALRDDPHDLMHKAVGWMLREVGKRDRVALDGFLAEHAARMPRTMLRYAIEKHAPAERARWLEAGR